MNGNSDALDAFRKRFEPQIFGRIVEFGKRLSQIDSGTVVTMARKATCLVEAMETLNLTQLQVPATSDRVFDMDLSWVAGQKMTLVDDALITGTTLARAEQALLEAGAASVDIIVLCVNERWWAKNLSQPSKPYALLNDRQTISVCSQIVDAISVVPVPYSVDYPLFDRIRIPCRRIQALLGEPDWKSRDLTTPLQRDERVFNITYMPEPRILSKLDKMLGWNLSMHGLMKIRVYGRIEQSDREVAWCSALPIVALNPLSTEALETLWVALKKNSNLERKYFWDSFSTPESKLRLIQYIAASALASLWHSSIQQQLSSTVELRQNQLVLRNIFPPGLREDVSTIVNRMDGLFGGFPCILDDDEPKSHPLPDIDLYGEGDSRTVQARLTAPFLKLYHEEEIPARNEARLVSKDDILKLQTGTSINRLRCGYTIEQLLNHVNHLGLEAFDVLSVFLDQAIDRGVVVPITAERDGKVFRAYRHGEDVLFSEAQIYLFQLALVEFISSSKRTDGIPRIWIEKVLVILIRILVQKKLVNPVYRHLDSEKTVGIRYSLHGAVVRIGRNKLYGFDENSSLIQNLQDRGLLKKSADQRYLVEEIDGVASKDAEHMAIAVGQLFGMLAKKEKKQKNEKNNNQKSKPTEVITNKELILIATCPSEVDVAAALAAELDIVVRGWKEFSKTYLNLTSSPVSAVNAARSNISFIAINNGEWKFTSARRGLPWKIIHDIGRRFNDRLIENLWESFWPTHDQVANPGDLNIERLVNEQGSMLLRLSIYVRLLEISFYYNSGDLPRAVKIAAEVNHLKEKFATSCAGPPSIEIGKVVKRLNERLGNQTLEPTKLLQYAHDGIASIVDRIPAVLAQVDLIAFQYGKPVFVNCYEHAMHIRLIGSVSKDEAAFNGLRTVMQEVASKAGSASRSATLSFPNEDPDRPTGGFWALAKGEFSRRWLVRLASRIAEKIGLSIPMQFVIFPNLPNDMVIYQNGMESVYRNERFWSHGDGFISSVLPSVANDAIIVVGNDNTDATNGVFAEIKEEFGGLLSKESSSGEVEIGCFSRDKYSFRTLRFENEKRTVQPSHPEQLKFEEIEGMKQDSRCDVAVITIVKNETRAVIEELKKGKNYQEWKSPETGRWYYSSSVMAEERELRVILTQSLKMGNRSVVNAFHAFRKDFSPKRIVLLGIAGSIQKDVGLCDVVLADRVIFYESRSETSLGPKRRGEFFRAPADLIVEINAFLVHSEIIDGAFGSFKDTFTVHLGPVASGEAVVKYREADVAKWIEVVNEKTACIEMEAAGFSEAADEATLEDSFKGVKWLIVRGISDHADEDKDDKWQAPAVKNALAATMKICSRWV